MDAPYINIHTHRRAGEGIEVVSVMAGRGAREAARAAVMAGEAAVADLAGTASVESALPEAPFSIGIHPWQLARQSGDGGNGNGGGGLTPDELDEALREVETAPAWAIGEIGLDHAIPTDRDLQKTIFDAQLRIAVERRLPVVLHCVRAFEPTMEILGAHPNLSAVIFHGFVGSPEQAARAVKAGYYLSPGERSFASPKTVEALRGTPPERIFLETDDAPVPIAAIYSRAGEILAIPIPELVTRLYENYERLAGSH